MQYKSIKYAIASLFIVLCTQLSCTGKNNQHENILTLYGFDGDHTSFNNFGFDKTSFYPKKQKYKKEDVQLKKGGLDNWYLSVKAENQNTKAVANKFKYLVGHKSNCLFGRYPKKLSFVVSGTLGINITKKIDASDPEDNTTSGPAIHKRLHLDKFTIGRKTGPDGSWWFGGVNCTDKGRNYVECTTRERKTICLAWYNDHIKNGISEIVFSLGKCDQIN
ncbi:MAG: hypothetical protein OXD32_05120 [Endozoicomonadaceae bacterium]|nr:hypothetical protein [Endozoicomonadaceae bacterium]